MSSSVFTMPKRGKLQKTADSIMNATDLRFRCRSHALSETFPLLCLATGHFTLGTTNWRKYSRHGCGPPCWPANDNRSSKEQICLSQLLHSFKLQKLIIRCSNTVYTQDKYTQGYKLIVHQWISMRSSSHLLNNSWFLERKTAPGSSNQKGSLWPEVKELGRNRGKVLQSRGPNFQKVVYHRVPNRELSFHGRSNSILQEHS